MEKRTKTFRAARKLQLHGIIDLPKKFDEEGFEIRASSEDQREVGEMLQRRNWMEKTQNVRFLVEIEAPLLPTKSIGSEVG